MADQKVDELRNQIIKLGKEVAESQSTTQFPESMLFNIGISHIEGFSFDDTFWNSRLSPGTYGSN